MNYTFCKYLFKHKILFEIQEEYKFFKTITTKASLDEMGKIMERINITKKKRVEQWYKDNPEYLKLSKELKELKG